jgi:CRP/FNR family cyclic AMP-dependent transcriptional regulator
VRPPAEQGPFRLRMRPKRREPSHLEWPVSGSRRTLEFPPGGCATLAITHRILLPLAKPARLWPSPSLLPEATVKHVSAGDVVFREGSSQGCCWFVSAGVLIAWVSSAGGRRSILEFLGPGDLVADAAAPTLGEDAGAVVSPEVRTLSPCRLLVWPVGEFAGALRTDERTGAWLFDRQAARLARARASLARSLSLSVPERIEAVLHELATMEGLPVPGGVKLGIPISQELLAAAVGATRETVNRSIRTLQTAGRLRRSGGRYTILTPSGRNDPPPSIPPESPVPPAPA